MLKRRAAFALAVTLASGVALGACQRAERQNAGSAAAAPRAPLVAGVQRVNIAVTADGFVPERSYVRVGVPVSLSVTRTVEQTCAKDIVIEQYAILAALPLNQTVQVRFTPSEPGRIRFASCAINMVAGEIVVD
jgi:plastocyanin domain-containing protein